MQFIICSADRSFALELTRLLKLWLQFTCADLPIVHWSAWPETLPASAIFFIDADAVESLCDQLCLFPPKEDSAVFICDSDPKRAIQNYALRPTGLLRKPLRSPELKCALEQCMHLWWDSLRRLDVTVDRTQIRLPLPSLMWAETTEKGCLLHCTETQLSVRIPILKLESLCSGDVILHCQRSFLVNVLHVQQIKGGELTLTDGSQIPLGRSSRAAVLNAFRAMQHLRAIHSRTGGNCP